MSKTPTAEEIIKAHIPCNCGEIYLSRNLTAPDCPFHSIDWETPMQFIAELSFDAGFDKCDEEWNDINPTKEQFIKQLFPE